MYLDLKESTPHGTSNYSFTQYNIKNLSQSIHIPVHWHDEIEIIYIKKGRLHIYIDGHNFDALAGEVYYVNPGVLHYMDTDDLSVDYYAILFPLDFISFKTNDGLEKQIFSPLKKGRLLFPYKISDCNITDEITDLLNRITDENKNNQKEESLHCQIHTRILLLQIIELLHRENYFEQPSHAHTSRLQREIISYIQQHHTEKISLEMLSKEFHLSEKYLSRYFKMNFSISFKQYVGHLRMSTAVNLLETTDLSVTDIALNSGFQSVNLFIRVFKANYGITPLQYRKN